MGLDMFLYRKSWVNNQEWLKPEYREEIKMTRSGKEVDTSRVRYIVEEVGYWRKANQIHKWFVDTIQKGEDDCGEYSVSYDELKELKSICERVLHDMTVEKSTVTAEAELPTHSGFFFGGTEYDKMYQQDLKDTVKIVEQVLSEPEGQLTYISSW